MHGLYILAGPSVAARGRRDGRWDQIAPTFRQLLGLPAPGDGAALPLVS